MKVPYFWLKDYIDTDLKSIEVARLLTMAGHALDKPIENDVMDFEDRGNRADVMGIIGLACDLAALTGTVLKMGTVPEKGTVPILVDNRTFEPKISVETEKVIRWTAVTFKNIKIQPSVSFVAERLTAYGLPLISNIVDLTNFVMIELGMPLHAFDTDRLSSITLRSAKEGERLITLDGTNLQLTTNDLVATDGEKPLTLTTAVGGRDSSISNQTVNILVEAGLYHQPTARRSALHHNIRNETVSRLGKYLHPHFCQLAVERFVHLMKEFYGYDPEPGVFDYFPENYQKEYAPKIIELTPQRLNLVAGEEIFTDETHQILTKLGFIPKIGINPIKGIIPFEAPYFRTDVEMEDDLIEEVLRIRGFDKLPSYLPERPTPQRLNFPLMELEDKFRDAAVKLRFNEVVSQPIIDVKDSLKVGLTGEDWQKKMVFLENSWNQELNLMRPEMISGQLKYLLNYQKRGIDDIKIFEIGKTYTLDPSKSGYHKYLETRKAVVTTSSDYLNLKRDVEALLSELGIRNYEFKKIDLLFKKSRVASITVNGEGIGKIGEVKNSVLSQFGLKGPVSHAVFYIDRLVKVTPVEPLPSVSTTIINYISEDYTFTLPADREVGTLLNQLKSQLNPSTQIILKGVFQDEKMKKKNKKSVTLNLRMLKERLDKERREVKKYQ